MRQRMLAILMPLLALAACGCAGGCARTARPAPSLAAQVAEAHGVDALGSSTAISAAVHLELNQAPVRFFDARLTHDLRQGRTRMLLPDDSILVWDGSQAWISPASSRIRHVRQTLQIWPFLVTLPFRLTDPAVRLSEPVPTTMAGADYLLTELTLPGHDPLSLYIDPQSRRIRHLILPARDASQVHPSLDKPLAISFYNFQSVDGVHIPETWRLWAWTREGGIQGGPVGEIRVYNVGFPEPTPQQFSPPPHARAEP